MTLTRRRSRRLHQRKLDALERELDEKKKPIANQGPKPKPQPPVVVDSDPDSDPWEDVSESEVESDTKKPKNKSPPPQKQISSFYSTKKRSASASSKDPSYKRNKRSTDDDDTASTDGSDSEYQDSGEEEEEDLRTFISKHKIPLLKARLRDNDQLISGNKSQLVDRIITCMNEGCLPRCPACGLGRLKLVFEGYYKCPGGFDDDQYVPCRYSCYKHEVTFPQWQKTSPNERF